MTDPQSPEDLFCHALELPEEQRQAYLDTACKDAPNLRRLIDDLLRQDRCAGEFLREPLLAPAAGWKASASTTPARVSLDGTPPRFAPGQLIADRFVVARFLARGGMGEVYAVEDTLLRKRSSRSSLFGPR